MELKIQELKTALTDTVSIKNTRDLLKSLFNMEYTSLVKELNLSPDKLKKLKDLYADREMASLSVSLEMWETTPSEAKRVEFKKRLDNLGNEYKSKISELLGEDDYENINILIGIYAIKRWTF